MPQWPPPRPPRIALKCTCAMCLADSRKKLVRKYIVAKGFYSYNAADETEDPVQRWIGREEKRFLAEAHIHLPFLLRMANAPPDLVETLCNGTNANGAPSSTACRTALDV